MNNITFGSSITKIGSFAFYDRSSLKKVSIPSSVTSLGSCAFRGCQISELECDPVQLRLGSIIDNKSALTKLIISSKSTTFKCLELYYFDNLSEIVIRSPVTEIGDDAFCGCSNLKSISLPSSVRTIGRNAFQSCSSLTQINIPSSVTAISMGAFYACNSLKKESIPPSFGNDPFYYFDPRF